MTEEEIPICEKISPRECLIISRDDKSILVACNNNGTIELNRISYPKSEE